MTMKSYANFEERLTSGWKEDIRNLANFHQSTGKSQNWNFDGILLSKVEGMTMKNNTKFEEELTFHFKTDRNLTNFDLSTQKCKNIVL